MLKTSFIHKLKFQTKCISSFYSSFSYDTKEYDLLQRSIVPTKHFQKSMPGLPVPSLEETLQKYQASQECILDANAFTETKKHIESFRLNEGPKLHGDLMNFQKTNSHTNYVNIIWTDKYLKDREPVVLTHNPTMVFKNSKNKTSQIARATNLIFSSIRFARSLNLDLLEPLIYHRFKEKSDTESFRKIIRLVPSLFSWHVAYFLYNAFPLDMSQLKYLFNTTRIPKPGKDELVKNENANHLLVIHNGQMYIFDIFQSNGHSVKPEQIYSNLRFILNQPVSISHQLPGLGILTTMNRDKWSTIRQQLIQLGNEETLRKIDSAAFVVALDNFSYSNQKDSIYNTLHGPAENRWFDKSFSLIIDSKGDTALNFEHSWGDGIAVLSFFEEVFRDSEQNPQFSQPLTSEQEVNLPTPQVDRLEFFLNSQFTDNILPTAKKEYDSKRHLLNLEMNESDCIGSKFLSSAKFDPDAIMQLAFQMAYYKMNGKQAPSYESVSTSGFKDGRTETLRPATAESKLFCELAHNPSASNSNVYDALQKCSDKHCRLKLQALMGKGWDRHLMGLKYFAQFTDKIPDLFSDPSYEYINKIILSTSTVPSTALEMGAFAAVTLDGYGIGYRIFENECGAIVSNWNNSSHSNGSQYISALMESFKKIREIIDLQAKSGIEI